MAGTAEQHRAGTALGAGGSDTHVEPTPEARGSCECLAANEAAQHVAVVLLISVDLYCFPIAVRASHLREHRAGIMDAGPALSAGGSEAHVETKAEVRGACECSAANEAAQHVAVALLISVDLCCFRIAVRAFQWLEQRGSIMLEPH